MTSSCIKLKILLLSPSGTEKANIVNLSHFWDRNEDIISCLQQRRGIVTSKYIDGYVSEESKLEAQKQQPVKTFRFKIERVEKNKRFEIKLFYDPKQLKGGDAKEVQAVLAKRNDMDGILLLLKGREFEDIFESPKHFEDSKKRNPQLITLLNGKEPDLKFADNLKDVFCYRNEIFDVDPEVLLNDSEKQTDLKEMNQKARETFLEIFQKLWTNGKCRIAIEIDEELSALLTKENAFAIVPEISQDSSKYTRPAAHTGENNDLESIEMALKKFKRLKSFSVTLSGITNLKKGDLDYLRDGLKRLKSLREVDINFNGTYNCMNQSRMTDICESLSKFPHLKGLKLLMHGSREFDDVAMKTLCDSLSLHPGLQKLFLDFSGSGMTLQGFQTFYRVLKKLPNLTNLTVLFVRSENISHDAFLAFCQSLRGLRSLEELSLNFSYCPLLTKESLGCLRDSIDSLIDIHSASLLFVWCKKISLEDVKDLKESLLELRPFKNLVVRT